MNDTGYRCPPFSYMGMFPFGIHNDFNGLLNHSGYSGPIETFGESDSVSGIVGNGTFYPQSGNLDTLTRMFWCVKSWNLTVDISMIGDASFITCESEAFDLGLPDVIFFEPPFFDSFSYCGLGIFNGSYTSLPSTQILLSKTLSTQDLCSYHSDGLNLNKDIEGSCPYPDVSGTNPNTQVCVPINPVQKFNDLLCRESFFSWSPSEEVADEFYREQNYQSNTNPYVDSMTQFRVFDPPLPLAGYDCGPLDLFDEIYSMFSLSIMDSSALAVSGNCIHNFSGYYPNFEDLDEKYRQQKCGPSGEYLTDQYGAITGYGYVKDLAIDNPPLVYDNFKVNSSDHSNSFNPFIHFQLKLRTAQKQASALSCPLNATISSLQTSDNMNRVGTLKINDFISGLSTAGLNYSRIFEIPLYSRFSSSNLFVEATLTPEEFWADDRY